MFEKAWEKKSNEVDHLKEGMDFLEEYFRDKNKTHIYPNVYCEKCKTKIRLMYAEYLPMHMEQVHRVFKCNECEYSAESDRGRKYHMKTNHGK